MATAARTKKAPPPTDEAPRPRRRRRWLFTATILIGFPALLWFAPVIVGFGPILNRVVARATGKFHGTITVGGASLGWLSSIVVQDIDIRDADGRQLFAVPEVTSDKTLLQLLTSPRDLGTFRLERPQVDLVLREHDSNVEEAAGAMLHHKDHRDAPPARVGITLVVNEGTAHIDDAAAGRQWQIDGFACEVVVPRDLGQELAVTATGRVAPGEPAGQFSLRLKVEPGRAVGPAADGRPPGPLDNSQGEIVITSQALPLELFEPLLRRVAPGSELTGTLETDVTARWNSTDVASPQLELDGQVTVAQLALVGPWTGDDRFRLEHLHVPCSVLRNGQRLEVRRCDVQSDIGQLTCSGAIGDLRTLGPEWIKSLWSVLPHSEGEIKGSLDLAKLSRVLPTTLRVREGMQINEGAVNVDLTSGLTNGQWACTGRVETTRLLATEQGRQISWDHPLVVTVAGHDTPQGPVIEHLNGESDFLKFEGSGTPDFFGLTANFELARLAEELGQFLDMGAVRIGGDGWSRLTWKRAADDSFEADAELQATNFVLARPGKPAWNDAKLVVTAAVKGQLDGKVVKGVETASVQVASATDEFTATLVSPVAQLGPQAKWPVDAHLRGELARWLARLEPWFTPPPGWDISGQAEIVSNVTYANDFIEIEKCQADFATLHAWGPTTFIDEPRLRLTGNGQLDLTKNTLLLKDVTLTSADVGGRLQDATFALANSANGGRIDHAEFQGNLATLERWLHDPRLPSELQISGLMSCNLHADLGQRSPALDLNVTIDDLAVQPRTGQPWRERQLRVTANATYDESNDAVQLTSFAVDSDAIRLAANGRIDRWSKDRELALSGKADYDLEKLTLLLQPYFGNDVRATGRESKSFSLAGPIGASQTPEVSPAAARDQAMQQMVGKAEFGWQTASLLGFDVAGGNLQASLAGGTLQIVPTRLNVSGGTLTLAPVVRLAPLPAVLQVPAGPLIEQVRATPEMCRLWMMYVAPALAGITKVDGTFSVQLAGCQVPLAQPNSGEVAGQVVVNSLDVEPGPLVQELSVLLGSPSTVRLAQNSKIDFKMVQGRVYHRGLELQFPEVTVRTYGSVGLDQTLAIMAEMNVPTAWIRDSALRENLKNQTIQVPIAGTLARPEIDRQKLAEIQAKFVRDAAGGALRNGLQRQLDRLLSPLEPKQ
ncbi:MAG TPA: hypothetical protein VGG64_18905 [Pirellulales bacterium]